MAVSLGICPDDGYFGGRNAKTDRWFVAWAGDTYGTDLGKFTRALHNVKQTDEATHWCIV